MSEPADLLLTDPGDVALAAALEEGVSRWAQGGLARWRSLLLDEVADNACGHSYVVQFPRSISASWWTDHRGSKHVRISGDEGSLGGWHPFSQSTDQAPALRRVFLERVFRVTRPGDQPRWLVSCACGMTGLPEKLAWMGERCGPCHDRREEGLPHPEDGRPTLFVGPGAGAALAFSTDGRRLVASSGGSYLRIYDLMSGAVRVLNKYETDAEYLTDANRPIGLSPDGRWLVSGLAREWLINWWGLADGEGPGETLVLSPGDQEVRGFAFSPDGRLLASWGDQGHYLVLKGDGETLDAEWGIRCHCNTLAFSPDSQVLALAHAGRGLILLDTHSWKKRAEIEVDLEEQEDFQFLQYTPDGRRLVYITGDRTSEGLLRPPRRRLHVYDLTIGAQTHERPLPFGLHAPALLPDRHIAYVVHDTQHSPGEIHLFDLIQWKEAGRFAWSPDDSINCLAFSPDGQTLATLSLAGVVKLWPWRCLLEG